MLYVYTPLFRQVVSLDDTKESTSTACVSEYVETMLYIVATMVCFILFVPQVGQTAYRVRKETWDHRALECD